MGTSQLVLVERRDEVALLTLNRPEKRNALSLELIHELTVAVEEFNKDASIKAIITTGAGDIAYSSGRDLAWLAQKRPEEALLVDELDKLFFTAIRGSPKVTIAAVNGYALGAGMMLMLSHDLAIASERALIGMPEVIRGTVPRRVATGALRAIAPRLALELIITGRPFDANRAWATGLVNRVVPHERLLSAAYEWAKEITTLDPVTVEYCKKAAYAIMDQVTYAQAIEINKVFTAQHHAVNPKAKAGLFDFLRKEHKA